MFRRPWNNNVSILKQTIILWKTRVAISHTFWSKLHHCSLLFQVYSFIVKKKQTTQKVKSTSQNLHDFIVCQGHIIQTTASEWVFTLFWIFVTDPHDLNSIWLSTFLGYPISAVCCICVGKQRVWDETIIVSVAACELMYVLCLIIYLVVWVWVWWL